MAHLTGRNQVFVSFCESPRGGAKSLAIFCVCPHKQAWSVLDAGDLAAKPGLETTEKADKKVPIAIEL